MEDEGTQIEVTADVTEAPETPDAVNVDVENPEPIVVVVEDSASGTDEITAVELSHAERIVALEIGMETLAATVSDIDFRTRMTEDATEAAATAVAEMEPVLTETVGASLAEAGETIDIDGDGKDDNPPLSARKHWFFRNAAEWKRN